MRMSTKSLYHFTREPSSFTRLFLPQGRPPFRQNFPSPPACFLTGSAVANFTSNGRWSDPRLSPFDVGSLHKASSVEDSNAYTNFLHDPRVQMFRRDAGFLPKRPGGPADPRRLLLVAGDMETNSGATKMVMWTLQETGDLERLFNAMCGLQAMVPQRMPRHERQRNKRTQQLQVALWL